MSEPNHCPQCGTELDEAAPEGLCPECLLKLGLSGAIPPLSYAPPEREEPRPKPRIKWTAAALVLIAVVVLLAALSLRTPTRPPDDQMVRFTIPTPGGEGGDVALSPDATRLAFTAFGPGGRSMLWIHRMDSDNRAPLQGTEGAASPFWSPDSRYIGFFAQGKLKTVHVNGGGPSSLCDAQSARGGAWNRDGAIIFGSLTGEIKRVTAAGGVPSVLTPSRHGPSRNPSFLPGGRHFLFSSESDVMLGALDTPDQSLLIRGAEAAVYSSGYVLFMSNGSLMMAQPFDAVKLRLIGEARPVAEGIRSSRGRSASFTVSENGVLAYRNGDAPKTVLTWFDRAGKVLATVGDSGELGGFALSPDGKMVEAAHPNTESGGSSLWVQDVVRSTNMRLTFPPLNADSPVWSPDGTRIVFTEGNQTSLYQVMSNGAGQVDLLFKSQARVSADSWSRDGRYLIYTVNDFKKTSLWSLPLSGDRKPALVLESPFNIRHGLISPDGRWIAYVSDETGRDEVYVQTFPASTGKWLLSENGGSRPAWRGDGKEIFFIDPAGRIMTVDVTENGNVLRPGVAATLFQSPGSGSFAVSADGNRFLLKAPAGDPADAAIHVVLNWTAELRREARQK